MIQITKGRYMYDIPYSDRYLVQNDNNFTKRVFQVPRIVEGVDISGYHFTLQVEPVCGSPYFNLLQKEVGDFITLTWIVGRYDTRDAGEVKVNLRAADSEDNVFSSWTGSFEVRPSIDTSEQAKLMPPSYIEQGIAQVQSIADAVNADMLQTEGYRDEALSALVGIRQDKQEVSLIKDKIEEDRREVEENTETAEASAGTAAQALSDLLAMLGTDVATLTGGKLTPSQIPSLSINDVFEVADTAAMLGLTAERGDVALIVPDDTVADSYILAADDPTKLENWKKLGVSYVANAGHASTADHAGNADRINNHRLITMTQAQYESAVKDPDTVYLVG